VKIKHEGVLVKERPILFSGEMVRAILDGRKTVTRRVVKFNAAGRLKLPGSHKNWHRDDPDAVKACPYGQPGDRLWVRETWAAAAIYDEMAPKEMPEDAVPWFREGFIPPIDERPNFSRPGRWRPSIHMPRWASRLTLEVTGVRVERLRDIRDDGCEAEGIEILDRGDVSVGALELKNGGKRYSTARGLFAGLWDSLNAKRGFGWDKNPWVWVVEFKIIPVTSTK
jgi:hypothetical protein